MRRAVWAVTLMVGIAAGGCERRDQTEEEADPHLTLSVETPEALHAGGTGILRVTLANEGETVAEGGIVEVYVPTWLEFSSVEPPGMEVTVLGGDGETRLTYSFPDSLPPGDRRTVLQHLRVRFRPPPVPPASDTIDTVQLPPLNQTVRARLLRLSGEPAGAEVEARLHFAGLDTMPRPPADSLRADSLRADSMRADSAALRRDSLPPVDTAGRRPRTDTVPGAN